LPNDAQVVVSYPLDRTLASTLRVEGFNDTDGGFSADRFKANMGFGVDDVHRVISTMRLKDEKEGEWVFTVLQTKKPYKNDAMKAALRLAAKEPVKSKTKSYDVFQINTDLDSLSNILLKFNKPRDQFLVHFLDANTMVFADPAPMKKFLESDAKPDYLSKEPVTDAPGGGTPSGPPGVGTPGTMPGGVPGVGAPGTMPGGAPGVGAPGTMPGGAPGVGTMPGGAPGVGMPGTMPGGAPGVGASGGQVTTPSEVVASNYMTVDPSIKTLLDRIEVMKTNEKTRQKEIAAVVSFAALASPLKPMISGSADQLLTQWQVPTILRGPMVASFNSNLNKVKSIGGCLATLNSSEANLSIALEMQNRRDAEAIEKLLSPRRQEALPFINTALGLTITTPAAGTNTGQGPGVGMPGGVMMPPGAGIPGGATMPPGATIPGGATMPPGAGIPGGATLPPGAGIPGSTPGIPGGNPGAADKSGDGTLTSGLFDRTLVYTLDMQLNSDQSKEVLSRLSRWVMQNLKSDADLASTRDRYGDLAQALTAYVNEKGEFPRGTAARGLNPTTGLPYRPDQRVSFYASLLPYLGPDFSGWKVDPTRGWNEDLNLAYAMRVLPPVLAHRLPGLSDPLIVYPSTPGVFGSTHIVGMAGVGMDAAEYESGNPKAGIFGYDRVTKKSEVKNPGKTIALILVPPDHKAPWIAGGGATVRAVADESEDANPLAPFVCITYPGKPGEASKWDGKRGTLALMADGKIRFLPADLPAGTFRAMCTIAGGKIDGLDGLCPLIEVPDRELKPDPKLVPVPAKPDTPKGPDNPASPKGPVSQDDQKAIQGTWKVARAIRGGVAAPAGELGKAQMRFTGNKVAFLDGGKGDNLDFELEPTLTPKGIKLSGAGPAAPGAPKVVRSVPGIYDLAGDTLRVCLPDLQGGGSRPTAFESPAGSKLMLVELTRAK